MGKHSRAKKARKELSDWVKDVLTRAHDGQRKMARETFEAAQTLEACVETGLNAGGLYDMARQTLDEVFQPKLACKKGCSYCCHIPVAASMPEVINAVKFAEATFPPKRFEALKERLRKADEVVAGLDPRERALRNVACPFLENDQCSVYQARPVACRAWHSLDVAPCQEGFQHPDAPPETPTVGPILFAGDAVREGLRLGLVDAFVDGTRVDLIRGAHWIVSDDFALDKWLAGVSIPDEVAFKTPEP